MSQVESESVQSKAVAENHPQLPLNLPAVYDDDDDVKHIDTNDGEENQGDTQLDLTYALPQRKKRKRDRKKKHDEDESKKIVRPEKETKYEYLDHTADIQLHSWGDSLPEAFEQIGVAMFGYMTELDTVEYVKSFEITAKGHDIESLLFHFLDELLVTFGIEEYLLFKDIEIIEYKAEEFEIKAVGYGEHMDLKKHPQGTEVKAITYSAMQIKQTEKRTECWVVVDI